MSRTTRAERPRFLDKETKFTRQQCVREVRAATRQWLGHTLRERQPDDAPEPRPRRTSGWRSW